MTRVSRNLLTIIVTMAAMSCMPQSSPKPTASNSAYPDMYIASGTVAPSMSMGFEAVYDPKLDNLVPGYKIFTVAISNKSLEYFQMDPLTDQWWVIDRSKSKHKAILSLREKNPDLWAKLNPRLRKIMEYPLMVGLGESETIDLLFPDSENLSEFREVVFQCSSQHKTIHIVPRE